MTKAAFTLESVSFGYTPRRPPVLNNFSRVFHHGLSLLCGPSGGGKSTVLKLLAGFLAPTSGRVLTHHGRPPDHAFLLLEVGFVFQQFNLLPVATLRENLTLSGAAARLDSTSLARAIETWLNRLDLQAVANAPAGDLSGGQLQRAALARALVKNPSVLLLDEPTSGLDEANTKIIASIITEWCDAGKSVIVSTHDPRLTACFPQADALQLTAAP